MEADLAGDEFPRGRVDIQPTLLGAGTEAKGKAKKDSILTGN
jgi:hypothetical protein